MYYQRALDIYQWKRTELLLVSRQMSRLAIVVFESYVLLCMFLQFIFLPQNNWDKNWIFIRTYTGQHSKSTLFIEKSNVWNDVFVPPSSKKLYGAFIRHLRVFYLYEWNQLNVIIKLKTERYTQFLVSCIQQFSLSSLLSLRIITALTNETNSKACFQIQLFFV